jgi:2-isopropylmalate synthase/UPF0716 protein FxsA
MIVLIYLFLEVIITISIASEIGGILTFVEILASAFIGLVLLKTFKNTLALNIKDLTNGTISQGDFIKHNMGKVVGAILLIVPGFLTDMFGVLLQFGLLTMMLTKIFSIKPNLNKDANTDPSSNNQFYYQSQFTNSNTNFTNKGNSNEEDIIDVEIIDNNKHLKH